MKKLLLMLAAGVLACFSAIAPSAALAADLTITAASVVAGSDAAVRDVTWGTTVTAGKAVTLDSSTGKWVLADSNHATAALRVPKGIALNGGGDGQPGRVLTSGSVTIGATLTAGVAYYLSDTGGGICPVADVGSGERAVIIGIATSTTVLKVAILDSGVAL